MGCRKIDGKRCKEVIDGLMALPKPGDKGYDDAIEFMRADLDSGMGYSKIEMIARKLIKEDGKDFDEEFTKYQIRQKENNTLLIIVWPDGMWCHEEDLWEYTWKSDDYGTFRIPTCISDEEIGIMAENYYG